MQDEETPATNHELPPTNIDPEWCRVTGGGAGVTFAPLSLPGVEGVPEEEDYRAAGWLHNDMLPPMPPQGMRMASMTFREEDGGVVADYEYEPAPRTFSKMKVVAALTEEGVWEDVKAWIEGAGLYDIYLAAQNFAEGNEHFAQGKAAIQSELGWSDERTEALLARCVAED